MCEALSLGTPDARARPTFQTAKLRTILARPGATSRVGILCSGLAAKFFDLPDGRRQILLLRRPAQFLLGCSAISEKSIYSAMALTDVVFAQIERSDIISAVKGTTSVLSKIAETLSRDHDEVAQLTVDLGRRSAQERICHLFCKFVEWSNAPIEDNSCIVRVPLRQEDIADYLGLTTAHVNRTIAGMRREKLVTLEEDRLRINDYAALRSHVA